MDENFGRACVVVGRRRHGLPVGGRAQAAVLNSSPPARDRKLFVWNLRHTWTTTMSSSAYRDTLQVRLIRDGVTGHGEGAPIVRYQENAVDAEKAVESVRDLVTAADPWEFDKLEVEIARRLGPVRRPSRSRHCLDGLGRAEVGHPALPLFRPRPQRCARHHFFHRH